MRGARPVEMLHILTPPRPLPCGGPIPGRNQEIKMKKGIVGVLVALGLAVLAGQALAIKQLPKVCYKCDANTGVCKEVPCDD